MLGTLPYHWSRLFSCFFLLMPSIIVLNGFERNIREYATECIGFGATRFVPWLLSLFARSCYTSNLIIILFLSI